MAAQYDAIIVGGAAVTEEITPGFRASIFSYIMGHVHPNVIRELELAQFGLEHLKIRLFRRFHGKHPG